MKNKAKFLRIIALAAVIGFSLAGCADGGSGGNRDNNDNTGGGVSPYLGDTLELSGQVYLSIYEEGPDGEGIRYDNYNGNLTVVNGRVSRVDGEYEVIVDDHPVLGQITNGQLSYSIGTPSNLYPLDFEEVFGSWFFGFYTVRASKANVRGYEIAFFAREPSSSSSYYSGRDLYKARQTLSRGSNSFSDTFEDVCYVYVEEDVTVSGTGTTETYTDTEYGIPYTQTITSQNFSFALRAGWNAVYQKDVDTYNQTSSSYLVTLTTTKYLGNPSNLLWVLEDDYYNYSGSVQESRSLLNAPETGNPDRIRQRRGK